MNGTSSHFHLLWLADGLALAPPAATAWAGPLWIVATVLVVSGAWKLAAPDPARGAMRRLRVPLPALATTLVGLGELALGGWALVLGGPRAAAAVAGAYLAFAAVALALRGTDVSCGCFGAASTPVTGLHVAVDLAAAALAATAALTGVAPTRRLLRELPAAGVPHVLLTLAGAGAVVALLTVLPAAQDAARRRARPVPVTFTLRGSR